MFLENSGLSVLVHLLLVAVMITSFAVARETIVAPPRPKLMQVDLSQVKVSREKTTANSTDEKSKTEESPRGQGKDKTSVKPASKPVKKIVAVQRDKEVLNRHVNVSVSDALRIAMTRCWQIDTSIAGLEEFNVSAHLTMSLGGWVRDLWIENEAGLNDGGTGSYVLESVRAAIQNCQPFSMLPDTDFEAWKNVKLNFFPAEGAVN